MLDPYDELETLRKGRLASYACMREINATKDTCKREHGKNHPVECQECWTILIDHLRDRYLNSALKEWFSGRRVFLQELDDLFAKARQRTVDFQTIEQRITDEKKEWFRDKARNLGLHLAAKSPSEARLIQQKISDREISSDQLLSEIKNCLGMDGDSYEEVYAAFLEQVKPNQTPAGRAKAYTDALFQPQSDPAGATKSQKYIDMITAGKPVGEVIATMSRDRQSAKVDVEQKEKLQKKLEELRRAKAAHQLDKAKRDQARQARAQAAKAAQSEAYHLPSCSVCNKAVDPQNILACPMCHVVAEVFKVADRITLFCSVACRDEGHEPHVQEWHVCSAGASCLSLSQSSETAMELDEPEIVFCRPCVKELRRAPAFCSSRCFDANFRRHREDFHGLEPGVKDDDMIEEGQIRSDAEEDDDEPMGTIWKPEKHMISLRDALGEWQKREGAVIS
ncbi:hypothetical protein F5Y17DRAFT_439544 [Xylariaceae sp. FL0594]|nr:hypothetical protein F5Y17DRAFT_439544 [Xylariaceae sp. FL0594]